MAKINILSETVCNRIAAGEVIDRPYSVVKELVENSIDAGATEIEIYIERGGKDLIKVVDNGCGIEEEDMRTAFIAHATSKISELEDIDHIHTLGFRGEALATISAVAYVEMISSTDGVTANRVFCDGEFIGKVTPAPAAPKGTQITVTNLFFNTPVRFKFMRSDKKEEADITHYVVHFMLGRPDISFKYYVDGKLLHQSYGGGLDEAVTQVYGANFLPKSFKIGAERNDIKISGLISNQNFFKPNKTYQSIYINGRYVINSIITTAITNAYAAYTMKRQYPFFVLFFEMPDELVDINVHPNKQDVRFVNNQLIYGTVYKVISSVLDGTAKAAEYVVEDENTAVKAPVEAIYAADYTTQEKVYDKDFDDVEGIEQYEKKTEPVKKPVYTGDIDYSVYEDYPEPSFDALNPKPGVVEYPIGLPVPQPLSFEFDCADHRKVLTMEDLLAPFEERKLFRQCKYRCTLFNTYLVYEMKNDAYIIDQHAAHERLLYDEFISIIKSGGKPGRQMMLVPYIFIASPEEQIFIEQNIDYLWHLGFAVERSSSNSFRVLEIPAELKDLNIAKFFEELLSQMSELKKIDIVDILKEKIAQTACKHAIKGGDVLTDQERDKLFEMLDGDFGLKCPHGRPICVKLSKLQLEKMFKRKV